MKIQARFYETYELCAIVDAVLDDPMEHARMLEAFHCDDQWTSLVEPFEKNSAFHRFISFIVHDAYSEQAAAVELDIRKKIVRNFVRIPAAIQDLTPHLLPIEVAFNCHGIQHTSFEEYLSESGKSFGEATEDDIHDFMSELWLTQPYEDLLNQTVAEIFHVLFQNRLLLVRFNEYVSGIISDSDFSKVEDLPAHLFSPKRTLKRVRPPSWAQRAVFFRDRGRCVMCDKDLSGLTNLANVENYDHIVPLAKFGLNDVSNLQLLCSECNQQEKKDRAAITSNVYQTWF
ncbi:MAG: HNH endonuclease signature motif containing protein [Burkholderiaceae bacterium]|nr:HNH endonuclease signature motif containing protein [Burkholderiaceae bacterium]